MTRLSIFFAGLAMLVTATTAEAQVTWAAGAPGGTSGGSVDFSAGQSVLDTGIAAIQVGGDRGANSGNNIGNDYTFSLWINSSEPTPTGLATDNRWFIGQGSQGIHLGVQNGNSLEQGHWGADSSGTTDIQANQWVHATFTFDADGGVDAAGATTGLHEIFLNGVSEGSFAAAAPNRAQNNIIIGGRSTTGPTGDVSAWDGLIDDVAIFDSVLSDTDIAALVADSSQAVALGAGAYYNFEDDQTGSTAAVQGTGLGATDLSGITPNAIPEPASLALMLGLGAFGMVRRRRA